MSAAVVISNHHRHSELLQLVDDIADQPLQRPHRLPRLQPPVKVRSPLGCPTSPTRIRSRRRSRSGLKQFIRSESSSRFSATSAASSSSSSKSSRRRTLANNGLIDPASHRLKDIDACSSECEVNIAREYWFDKLLPQIYDEEYLLNKYARARVLNK